MDPFTAIPVSERTDEFYTGKTRFNEEGYEDSDGVFRQYGIGPDSCAPSPNPVYAQVEALSHAEMIFLRPDRPTQPPKNRAPTVLSIHHGHRVIPAPQPSRAHADVLFDDPTAPLRMKTSQVLTASPPEDEPLPAGHIHVRHKGPLCPSYIRGGRPAPVHPRLSHLVETPADYTGNDPSIGSYVPTMIPKGDIFGEPDPSQETSRLRGRLEGYIIASHVDSGLSLEEAYKVAGLDYPDKLITSANGPGPLSPPKTTASPAVQMVSPAETRSSSVADSSITPHDHAVSNVEDSAHTTMVDAPGVTTPAADSDKETNQPKKAGTSPKAPSYSPLTPAALKSSPGSKKTNEKESEAESAQDELEMPESESLESSKPKPTSKADTGIEDASLEPEAQSQETFKKRKIHPTERGESESDSQPSKTGKKAKTITISKKQAEILDGLNAETQPASEMPTDSQSKQKNADDDEVMREPESESESPEPESPEISKKAAKPKAAKGKAKKKGADEEEVTHEPEPESPETSKSPETTKKPAKPKPTKNKAKKKGSDAKDAEPESETVSTPKAAKGKAKPKTFVPTASSTRTRRSTRKD